MGLNSKENCEPREKPLHLFANELSLNHNTNVLSKNIIIFASKAACFPVLLLYIVDSSDSQRKKNFIEQQILASPRVNMSLT